MPPFVLGDLIPCHFLVNPQYLFWLSVLAHLLPSHSLSRFLLPPHLWHFSGFLVQLTTHYYLLAPFLCLFWCHAGGAVVESRKADHSDHNDEETFTFPRRRTPHAVATKDREWERERKKPEESESLFHSLSSDLISLSLAKRALTSHISCSSSTTTTASDSECSGALLAHLERKWMRGRSALTLSYVIRMLLLLLLELQLELSVFRVPSLSLPAFHCYTCTWLTFAACFHQQSKWVTRAFSLSPCLHHHHHHHYRAQVPCSVPRTTGAHESPCPRPALTHLHSVNICHELFSHTLSHTR